MNIIRLALLALVCALVPTANAQYGVPVNCDVPEHNGSCEGRMSLWTGTITHVTRCQRLP